MDVRETIALTVKDNNYCIKNCIFILDDNIQYFNFKVNNVCLCLLVNCSRSINNFHKIDRKHNNNANIVKRINFKWSMINNKITRKMNWEK